MRWTVKGIAPTMWETEHYLEVEQETQCTWDTERDGGREGEGDNQTEGEGEGDSQTEGERLRLSEDIHTCICAQCKLIHGNWQTDKKGEKDAHLATYSVHVHVYTCRVQLNTDSNLKSTV